MVKKRILTLVMAAALLISGVNYTEEVKAADLDTNKAAISSDKPEIKEEVLKEEEDKKEEESAKFMKYFDLFCFLCCLLLPIIAALWQWLASFIW